MSLASFTLVVPLTPDIVDAPGSMAHTHVRRLARARAAAQQGTALLNNLPAFTFYRRAGAEDFVRPTFCSLLPVSGVEPPIPTKGDALCCHDGDGVHQPADDRVPRRVVATRAGSLRAA